MIVAHFFEIRNRNTVEDKMHCMKNFHHWVTIYVWLLADITWLSDECVWEFQSILRVTSTQISERFLFTYVQIQFKHGGGCKLLFKIPNGRDFTHIAYMYIYTNCSHVTCYIREISCAPLRKIPYTYGKDEECRGTLYFFMLAQVHRRDLHTPTQNSSYKIYGKRNAFSGILYRPSTLFHCTNTTYMYM